MKKYFRKARENINETDDMARDQFADNVRQRGQAIEYSVKEGWFKPFLKTSMGVGLLTAGYGIANDDSALT
jgi:hypothetical protein